MKSFVPVSILIFLIISCSSKGGKINLMESKFDTLQTPKDSLTFYFPVKTSINDTGENRLDTFSCTWYSKMLFALKEPVLQNYQGEKEIYRFTYLRTFHHPISVRMEKQNNIIRLYAKVCNGAGGYEPGIITLHSLINIAINDWKILENKIKDTNFWLLPTESRENAGHDGSEWIIEAFKENKYHIVTRWSPGKNRHGNFSEIGFYLLDLSKIKEEAELLY